jgi:hypothetical protein
MSALISVATNITVFVNYVVKGTDVRHVAHVQLEPLKPKEGGATLASVLIAEYRERSFGPNSRWAIYRRLFTVGGRWDAPLGATTTLV